MADIKRCRGCDYWRTTGNVSGDSTRFCHHLLATGKRRVEVDGICQSFKPSKGRRS